MRLLGSNHIIALKEVQFNNESGKIQLYLVELA